MNTAFIAHGVLFALAAALLAPLLPQRYGRWTRILGVVTGVGLLLVGTFLGPLRRSPTAPAPCAPAALAIFGGSPHRDRQNLHGDFISVTDELGGAGACFWGLGAAPPI
ncbi:hypothetical protein [Streptomyces collinus]|uniref:Uncharacterized protein n=1 Tax=Streptomyces collinus TaxID=42684 RepID=A0AA89QGF9_STRCU|nr:hypothetical protein [Streptomyces collinus]MBB5816336.1 hypothetical protein [Streptomyces collinus]WMX69153.1 hypothetical protein RFN52_39935 [Streptomyces collinus]